MHKKLFVGPWDGEFGWELFCWHGMVRAYVEKHQKDFDKVTVCSRPGHEFLYARLYDDYVPLDTRSDETDMWRNREVDINTAMALIKHAVDINECEWLKPDNYRVDRKKAPHKFISFHNCCPPYPGGFDVLMHIRNTDKCNTGYRNWPIKHAEKVARMLDAQGLTIACIGLSPSSALASKVESDVGDKRDIPLGKLATLMSQSKIVVGPTSGPVHFAALCETPQVTWMTKTEHEVRVRNTWNPFNIPVKTLPSPIDDYWRKRIMWLPAEDDIYNNVMKVLERNFTE